MTNGPTVAPAPSEATAAPEPEPPAGETESDILELPSATPAPASPIELPDLSIEPPRVAEARSEARVPHEEPAMPAPPVFAPQTPPPDKQAVEAETPDEAMPATSGIGILLVNLGTPDAAEPKAVRRYLKEFLADRRVIENGRPALEDGAQRHHPAAAPAPPRPRLSRRSGTRSTTKSPLKTITRVAGGEARRDPRAARQATSWSTGRCATAARRSPRGSKRSSRRGCDRICCMPLYPQYSAATTATVCDEVFRVADKAAPAADAAHRAALLRRAGLYRGARVLARGRARRTAVRARRDPRLVSRHPAASMSTRAIPITPSARKRRGCCASSSARRRQADVTFQSRFGRAEWLQPYTDETVKSARREGREESRGRSRPGFSADCLETLEEIAVENAHIFKHNGGENSPPFPASTTARPAC